MKIKKTPVKKLAVPPLAIRNLIKTLKECPQADIAGHIEATPEWIWPRGDLFHWVAVLNRFDEILDEICKGHDMKKPQPKEFSAETKRLTLAILSFSRLLLESCTNRNLYASYEQLNDLLYARDIDVLESCLRLLLRPAQRHSAQRSARSIFTVSQDRLLALSHSWGNRDHGLDLLQLAQENVEIPERLTSLHFQFYRTISLATSTASSDTPSTTATTTVTAPPGSSASSSAQTLAPPTPSKQRRSSSSGAGASSGSAAPNPTTTIAVTSASEGMVVIQASDPQSLGATDYEILARLVEEYQVPEEHQFHLLSRIRVATAINDAVRRRQLLSVRILAIAVMSHVLPESVVVDKFFVFEPEIIQSLTDLIHPDHNVPFNLQTVTLFALDGLAHLRNKQLDVLTAINASASHGVLLYALRKIITGLDSENAPYPQDFLDAIFALVSFIISSQSGGNMVISAGLVPVLLQLLSNKHASQLKNVTKSISILDSLIYGFGTAFTSFITSNGLTLVVARMKEEVDYSLGLVKEAEASRMSDVSSASTDEVKDESSPIPFERTALLKAMFKFVHHMMQSPGTQEGLRNLIDTTLPATLKDIMENPSALGTAVYAHAINTMTSFIHNEPTSLAILQEAKIPQTLLASLSKDIPASTDVAMCIPGAFGAICLNPAGLEMFSKEFQMKKFFDIFTSIPHVRAFQDNDVTSNLGASMDELVRHQPTLKAIVMNETVAMLNGVLKLCCPDAVSADDMVHCSLQKTRAKDAPAPSENQEEEARDKKENLVPLLIEGAARFCESFFQSATSAKDFMKADGIDILMKFYTLPTLPYDLANTPAFFTLSHLVKLLSETNPASAITAVVREVSRMLGTVQPLLESNNPASDLIKFVDISDSSEDEIAKGNDILRSLISLHALSGLLSDMYCAPAFSHGRNSAAVLAAFVTANGDQALASLGQLHRMCVWESIAMRRLLQKNWNDPNPKAKKPLAPSQIPGTVDDIMDEPVSEDKEMAAPASVVDMYSPSVINTKYLKFVLTQIPHYITPMYQGVTKMLYNRRDVEAQQRANAFKIADSLSRVLQAHTSWKRLDVSESALDKYAYLNTMLRLLPFLFLDDRNPATLQTIMTVSFVRTGGLGALFTTLEALWKEASDIQSTSESLDATQKDLLSKIHSSVEIILSVLQTLTSSKLLHESSHTPALVSRDDKGRKTDFFEPHEFLVQTRLTILPKVRELWSSSHLNHCSANIVRYVIHTLINILKADGELKPAVSAAPPVTIGVGATPNIFGARPLAPDATSVATLLDMGFPRAAAEMALTRCGNQIDRATEYLLTHQEVVAAAIYDQEREEAAARAAASTSSTTAEPADSVAGQPSESSSDSTSAPIETDQAAATEENADDAEDDDDDEDDDEEMLQQALQMSTASASGTADSSATPAAEGSASAPTVSVREAEEASTSSKAPTKEEESEAALEAHKAQKEELAKEREEIKPALVGRSLELIAAIDDIVFYVRDLLLLLCKEKDSKVLDQLVSDMEEFRSIHDNSTSSRGKIFGTRLRLLALLFGDVGIQAKMAGYGSTLMPLLTAILTEEVTSPLSQKDNTWLSPLLLMVEGFISVNDEPKVVPDEATAEGKAKAAQEDKEMKEDVVSQAEMENLLSHSISLLKRQDLTKDIALSVFRILVRLTRHHSLAVDFLKADGLDLIFSTLKPERIGVQGQQSFIVMIMRHIIEDTQVLQSAMEKEIVKWFTQPSRPRTGDIQGYLRHNNYLGLRDLDAFIAGTLNVCKVTKYDSAHRTLQLGLAKLLNPQKPEEAKETNEISDDKDTTDKEKDAETTTGETAATPAAASTSANTASIATTSAAAIAEATKKYSSEVSEAVIHFLVSELLNCRTAPATAVPPPAAATATTGAALASSSTTDVAPPTTGTTGEGDKGASSTDVALDPDFVFRCFLLQCLNELLISYPSCKVDLMNYSRRKGSKDSSNIASKPKTNWLNYLLNDLIPYRGTVAQSSDTELRKHTIESNFASSVLVAMCSNGDDEEEKRPFSELAQVRRFVVDGITRSFKDAIASTEPIEIKYGKFLSLSELSYKILGSSPVPGSTAKTSDDMSINIVKVMLEKNFIMTLTNVLADIDLNYPHAKILVNAVLKPLEHLTKLSLKMSRASEPGAPKPRRRSTPLSAAGSGTGSGDDAPDLYRNSSLGMFDGAQIESEEDGESGDSSGEEDIFDGDEFEEETASDASDLSEEGLSDDDDDDDDDGEEGTVRNPFHHHSHEVSDDEDDQDDEIMDDDDDEEDDDMEAELQDALGHDDEDDEAMEWDRDDHRPVMLGDDEIGEVIDDDEDEDDVDEDDDHSEFFGDHDHDHHHHHHHHTEDEATGEEGEGEDEDDEDDGDEDDDEDDEEGEEDGMEDGGEFDPVRRPGRNNHWNMTSTFVINDSEALRNGLQAFDARGRRPRLAGRRLDDRGFLWNEAGADQGRFSYIEDEDFPLLGAPARNPFLQVSDDVITHPLLAPPPAAPATAASEVHRARAGSRSLGLTDWQSFEELLNGNANQVLGTLLNGGAIRAGHGAFRVEVNHGHGHAATLIPIDRAPQIIVPANAMAATLSGPLTDAAPSHKNDMFSIVHDFVPFSTSQRWSQECRMMYGATAQDKASRLVNHVVNALIPAAKEEMRLKFERENKEMEQRRKADAERKKAAEEKRKAEEEAERVRAEEAEKARIAEEAAAAEREAARLAEEAAARAARGEESTATTTEDTVMEVEETPAPEPAAEAEPSTPARRTVMIDGELVDITDSDIDPEFLEALPEEMRREVYNDYLQSHRPPAPPAPAATTAAASSNNINPDFLNALPQDMREELDEIIHGQRSGSGSGSRRVASGAAVNDYASTFSRLVPHLRQLYQDGGSALASTAPSLLADTEALLSQIPRHYPRLREAREILTGAASGSSSGSLARKSTAQRDAIQLVDKSSLATLVRLMFLPQPLSKNILNKLLVNLCENSKTRSELLSLLLSILQDGGSDLAAVDKSFAQMSLRGKAVSKTHNKGKGATTTHPTPTPAAMDSVPNLVARRCFESLYYIVSYNAQAAVFFLTEHENVTLKPKSKKGKGKDKVISSKYPIVLLLDLLERPIFVENSSLMEQLMTLLSIICRPLATLSTPEADKEADKDKAKATEETAAEITAPTETAPATESTESAAISTATTAAVEGSSTAPAEPSSAPSADTAAAETKAEAKPADADPPTLKPPVIPDHCIQLVVRVLTAGECSSRTFQYTLSVIQNLSVLEGARDVITSELVRSARDLGEGILENLDTLSKTLENAMSGVEVQGMALEKFSPASSKQAKLLRVLKTIDYMYSRKQAPPTAPTTQVNIELAPTLDPEEADAVLPRSMRDINSEALNLNKDEEKVTEIYDSLSFHTLWTKVGDTLEQIHERSDMIHVATVLLPLIESFMVVCKYVGLRPSTLEMEEEVCKATTNSTEELFLQFTDKHRKILNIMVRNNPALMSGSFSLLVHNPKMLEFDNKRNYFTQQLHKRNGAKDHYGTLQMNVRREMVFVDSFSHLQSRTGDEIKYSKLNVKFHGEEGVDAGGVTREWFQVLARQMFNPDYALFKTSAADKLTYQPNRASWVNSDHLLFFKFIGRVIGKAIYDGRLLDAYFTRSFYKHILGRPVDYRDVEAVDPEYYKSLVWMLENDITDIVDETFSVETDDFGNMKTVDLKPNGRNIPVTEENKHEYVKYITEQKLTLAIKDQIHSFLQGFHEVIPSHLISIFNEQELELLISGLPDIDVDEWKNNTEYQNYSPASPQIQNFWRAVRSFDQTERAKLLQFVTGTSKVPLGGFAQLQGISGIQKFQIHKDFSSTKRLPSAHTCFNQLDLPEYETYEDLRQQLLTAISECSTGFAFA